MSCTLACNDNVLGQQPSVGLNKHKINNFGALLKQFWRLINCCLLPQRVMAPLGLLLRSATGNNNVNIYYSSHIANVYIMFLPPFILYFHPKDYNWWLIWKISSCKSFYFDLSFIWCLIISSSRYLHCSGVLFLE